MRKLCAGILIFCMLLTQMVGVSDALASENIVYGDLTGDGRADPIDFAVMKMYLLGKISVFPSENGKKAADLNEDGEINAFDYAIFKQYLLNKITTLPYNPGSFVYKDIEPAKANELIKGNNIQIIDVRTAGEFETGFIEGAVNLDWHMNSTLFKQKLGSLDKNKAVLVYCASGKRSTESLEIFKSLNFKTVYNMKGGIAAWTEAGFAVKKPDPTKPEDPDTPINPAELPAVVVGKTTICGEVINSRTEELLSGVNVFLRNKPEIKTTTDANGRYVLEVEGAGDYVVDIEIEGYTSAQRTIKIEKPGYDYPVNKAYLVKLDTKVTEISSEGGVHTSSEGKIMMEFPAGAIPEGTTIKASATRFEKGEELPNALPELSHFTHAMELYPDGVNFLKPVTVKIKNVRGFKPGAKVPMGYYNKETSQWQDEGQAVVDSTGQWIVGEVKHFSPWDWNHPVKGSNGPPSGPGGCGGNGSDGPCSGASSGGNSTVDMGRGSLKNEIVIPGVRNMYGERDLQFNYNSRFANPVYLLDFNAGLGNEKTPLKTRFTFEVGSLKKEIFVETMKEDMRYRYLFDCTDAYGNKLPTGYYTTSMEVANGYQSEFYEAPFFGAPADAIRPTGVLTDPENPYWYGLKSKGNFAVVNSINSPFGAGWNLDELSRIYLTDAGNTIILVEGNAVVIYQKNDAGVFTTANPQDGKIIWADDERYHLILPKGEAFLYDRQGYIVTKKDTNGNKTTYSWDDSNKDGEKELAVITDPGDLKYTFEYINGKLKSMTDPAGAKNYFALDEKSNLLSAKLFDEEQWSFQYDGKHLMTGKTDANGGDTSYVYDVNGFVTDVYSPEREITEVGADGTEKTEKKREHRIYTASDSVGIIDTSNGKGTFKNPAKAVSTNTINYCYKVENSSVESGKVDNNKRLFFSNSKVFNSYDEAGRIMDQSDSSGIINEYTYDENGNIVKVTANKNNGINNNIDAGGAHNVALKRDGTVVCWGDNSLYQCNIPAGLIDVVAVSAGTSHTVALKKDGKVVCWGGNFEGECNVPNELTNVVAISAGDWLYTVALKEDGTVVCWGNNDYGQCNVPAGLTDVAAVSAGLSHTVALKRDGTVVCWGNNDYRQCYVPAGLTDVVAVSAGYTHTEALKRDGTVVCWGGNYSGQCNVPAGLIDVVGVAANESYTFALKKDGTVACWGENNSGQCNIPAGLTDVAAISTGERHVVALKKDGTVVCWGENRYGQCNVPAGLTHALAVTVGNMNLGFNSTKYEYTSNNNISKIIENADGEVQRLTQYFYDNAGNLTAAIAPDGLKTTYGYDSRGLKTYEELPNGTTITYQYDEKGWLTQKTVKADGKEAATTYTYDKRGNIATETLPGKRSWSYTYDNGNRKTSMTDPMGRAWKYEYDKMGNLIKEINPLSEEWQYKYDPKGMLTQVIDPTDTIKEKRYYNELRYLTKVEYADGSSEKYYVDNEGKTLKKFDTLGNAISFSYNEVDDLRSITDPQNGVITLSYDAISLGNAACCGGASGASRKVTQIKTPLGNTVEYQYNPFGEMTISADKNSNLTETNYDNGGNIVAVKYPDGTQEKMEYNLLGMVSKVTERDGTACQYDYDGLGRLVTFTDAAGKTETTTYDEAGNIIATKDKAGSETSYSYDEAGNLKQTTDALGNKTLYDYDDLNRLVKKTLSDGTTEDYIYDSRGLNTGLTITGKDGIKQETKCEYDARGRRITIVDANGFKKGFEYDSEGRLTKEKYPDGSANIYSYDSLGRLTKTTTPSGDEITYEYDADGRLLSKTADSSKTTYSYDKNSNILEASNDISKVTRTYDSLNRITKEIQSITGTDAYTSSYAYNSTTGRLDSETLGKTKVDIGYDDYGRLSTITSSAAGTFQYNYDADGRSEKLKNPNNVTLTNTYDELERPAGKSYSNDVFKALYNYNSVGKLTAENKAFENTATSDLYNYDSLGRLTGVKYNAPTVSGQTYDNSANFTKSQNYAYDLLNNRTSIESDGTKALYNQVDGKYSPDSLNRINTVDSQTILYDNNHNIINDGRLTYNWSSENSLKKVEENSKEVASYSYDPFGRRVKKALANGETTFYFYDGWQEAEDRDSKGNATVYTHGTDIDDLLAVTKQGKTVYTHSNFQGSVVAVTDAEGKVLERIGYDVYGKPEFYAEDGKPAANKVKSDYTEFLFTGRRLDAETGNYYYRARYYTPELGRFLSEDSLREGLNLYAYCGNDPVNFVDPSGNRLIVPRNPTAQRQVMSQLSKLTNYDLKVDAYGYVSIDGYHPGKKKDKGDDLILRLIKSNKRIKINVVCDGSRANYDTEKGTNGKGSDVSVKYDPNQSPKVPTVDPRSGRSYLDKIPNEIVVGHELIHADRASRGIADPREIKQKHTYMDPYGKSIYENSPIEEQKTVGLKGNSPSDITENDLRNEAGYKKRGAYYY